MPVFRVNRDNPRDRCDSWQDPDPSEGVHAGLQQHAIDEDEWQSQRFVLELDRTNEEALNIRIQQEEIASSTCPRCTSVDWRCGGLCVADAHEASAAGSDARATDEAVIERYRALVAGGHIGSHVGATARYEAHTLRIGTVFSDSDSVNYTQEELDALAGAAHDDGPSAAAAAPATTAEAIPQE